MNSKATVKVKLNECIEKYHKERGMGGQGDTIAPKLFTAVLGYAFKRLPLTWVQTLMASI